MATFRHWVHGARPRTLPAALAPVALGTGAAAALGAFRPVAALLALLVALALQVGVNYANDYSDGIRGTDQLRVGPVRLVGQQLAEPGRVRAAAFAAFAVAALAGLALVILAGAWWLLAVGAAAVASAWLYTGGRRPYGYLGLGEVFVFVFFGLVAVAGTTYTQAGRTSTATWAGAVGVGCLCCAILMANNIRDLPGDRQAGKRTLAVRLGPRRARAGYLLLLGAAAGCLLVAAFDRIGALAGLLAYATAGPAIRAIRSGADGAALVPVLTATGRLTLGYGLLAGIGIAFLG